MISPGNYRHYKGTLYRIILIGEHTETNEPMAVYFKTPHIPKRDENGLPQGILQSAKFWIRPVRMFEDVVVGPDGTSRPRFEREDDLPVVVSD